MKSKSSDPLSLLLGLSRSFVPKVDFHLHTTWTDGTRSVADMHRRAVELGLQAILFSEHGRKTSGDWFDKFATEVRALPKSQCRAFVGLETKVENFEGDLDCTPSMIEVCDLVVAVVHRFPGEKEQTFPSSALSAAEATETELRLSLVALENPHVDILGHPFGMSIKRFKTIPSREYFRKLIQHAADRGVAFEINTHYHPDPWHLIDWCLELGAKISLGSNAHSVETVGTVTKILEENLG